MSLADLPEPAGPSSPGPAPAAGVVLPVAADAAAWLPAARPLTGEALTAWERLARVRSAGERRAAVLALLLTPDSARERQAWTEELAGVASAVLLHTQVQLLPLAARLPVLERLLNMAGEAPLEERQGLLVSARRVMCADGRVRPTDRLRWLLMRHRLAGQAPLHRGGLRESADLTGLPLAMRLAAARFTAYLARLVPQPAEEAVVGAAGAAWYRSVVATLWGTAPDPPPCQPPDVDALGRALLTLRELTWLRRPLLARTWVDAALPGWRSMGAAAAQADARLPGAEALRIACNLLDTPVPPALARLFIEPPMAFTGRGT